MPEIAMEPSRQSDRLCCCLSQYVAYALAHALDHALAPGSGVHGMRPSSLLCMSCIAHTIWGRQLKPRALLQA